jgi:hypothetical protein
VSVTVTEEAWATVAKFSGIVTEHDAQHLRAQMLARPSTKTLPVVFDLLDADDFEVKVRAVFTDLQKHLATNRSRSAYVSDRPVFRGLATRIVHDADDPGARAVSTHAEAQKWLASQESRVATAFSGLQTMRIKLGGAR